MIIIIGISPTWLSQSWITPWASQTINSIMTRHSHTLVPYLIDCSRSYNPSVASPYRYTRVIFLLVSDMFSYHTRQNIYPSHQKRFNTRIPLSFLQLSKENVTLFNNQCQRYSSTISFIVYNIIKTSSNFHLQFPLYFWNYTL